MQNSRRKTQRKNRFKSYVWHYFERLGDRAKCRVCQHEIRNKKDGSTAALIWHIRNIHKLIQHGICLKDFSTIPTRLVQSNNTELCMRFRVIQSFEETGESMWRCKNCTYTVRLKKSFQMFHHLKTVHWKPTKPPTDGLNRANDAKIAQNAIDQKPINHTMNETGTSSAPIKIGEDEEPTFHESDSGVNSSRGFESKVRNSNAFVEEPSMNGHLNYESRPVSPIFKGKQSSSKEEKASIDGLEEFAKDVKDGQFFSDDNRRQFDHWYSRTSRSKSTAASSRQSRIQRSSTASWTGRNPGNNSQKMELEEPDTQELDIQVPLQNVGSLMADSNRDRNGQASVKYEYIKTEKAGGKQNVAVITLNRPKTLNALCKRLVDELNDAVTKYDRDDTVGAIVITGNERAFAAGSDNKEMQNYTYAQTIKENAIINWNGISRASKPVIAAVNGYALGGGCELALACDIIYAGTEAHFGQPEIVIGTIPGAGGTQRLIRVMGKSKAMEMILTGNQISAAEAEKTGLVSKIFPPHQLLSEAIKLGETISSHSQLIVSMAKESINSAYETTLQEGLRLEKKLFSGTFATADRKEGMAAFIGRRAPNFKNA